MPNHNVLLAPASRAAHAIASYDRAVWHGHLTHREWSALALHLAIEASNATGAVGAGLEARAEDALHRSREARHFAFSAERCTWCAGRVATRCCLTTGSVQHVGPGFVMACTAAVPIARSDRDAHMPRYLVVGPGVGAQLARPMANRKHADTLAARLNEEYGVGTHHVTGGES